MAAEYPELVKELATAARAVGAEVPTMCRGFGPRDGGMSVRVGPLGALPEDRGARVIDRIDQ